MKKTFWNRNEFVNANGWAGANYFPPPYPSLNTYHLVRIYTIDNLSFMNEQTDEKSESHIPS